MNLTEEERAAELDEQFYIEGYNLECRPVGWQ